MNEKELFSELHTYLIENYGEQCDAFELGCAVCMVWAFYGFLVDPSVEMENDE